MMQSFERPVWASWAWPIAFGALAMLFLFLPVLPIGRVAPIWSLLGFAVLVVGVVGWAVLRTALQRRQYEERLETWAKVQAVQDERLRIARELHDLASHGLGKMTIRAATAKLADEDERLVALDDIERLGRRSTSELRKMLAVLREPGAQAPMRPVDALADLPDIVETARRTGIEAELTVDDLGEVPASVQVTICAIVREGLANAARHAGATRARASIALTRRGISVDVRDSGPSPGWTPHPGTGHGIDGLRERVGLHGGTLTTGASRGRLPRARRAAEGGRMNDAAAIRVLLVDDDQLLRRSLMIAIDHEDGLDVVGEAATGTDAVAQARALRPDVVLMDIRMPGGNGIEATQAITGDAELTGTKVVVLTMFELDEYVYGALRAGASAFLLKDATPERLVEAIRRVHEGESLFAPQVTSRLVEHYVTAPRDRSAAPRLEVLTEREREVLGLVAEGLSNDEIAARLVVSMHTVKAHIGALRSKLHARDRAQLVIAAYENGIRAPLS